MKNYFATLNKITFYLWVLVWRVEGIQLIDYKSQNIIVCSKKYYVVYVSAIISA